MNIDPDKATLADVYKLLISLNKQNCEINSRLEKIEKHFDEELNKTNRKLKALEDENQKIKLQFNELSKSQKKYNIIINGVPEENDDDVNQITQNIIQDMLCISLPLINIRDIFRIGKKGGDKPRPILIELVSYQKKQEILRNAKKLKGSGIYINPDLTKDDLQNRKILTTNLKLAREKKYSARIIKNSLLVNGELYDVEQLKLNPLHLTAQPETPPTLVTQESNSAPPTPNWSTYTSTTPLGIPDQLRNTVQTQTYKNSNTTNQKEEEGKKEGTESIAKRVIKKRKDSTKS